MRGQIQALIEATERPNVQIQLLPFRVGGHAAAGGAFTILRFADTELPDVVYIEQLTGALYLDKRDDVDTVRGDDGAAVRAGRAAGGHGRTAAGPHGAAYPTHVSAG